MKKFLVLIIGVVVFGFNLNQVYCCKTLGISFEENNQTYEIPNNEKTVSGLKAHLQELYEIKVKPVDKNLIVFVGDKNDTLNFVKKVNKNFSLYVTKDFALQIMTDNNTSQMAINIPSQKMIIYYQCK